MYTMLINLFNGNLDLTKRMSPDFPLQKHYSKEYDKLRKQLGGLLNEEGKKLLDELLDTDISQSNYASYDAFIVGFKLAALLMIEVFYDKDKLLENKEQYLRNHLHRPFRGTPSAVDDMEEVGTKKE